MSDAPAVVPSEPTRLPLIRRWARFRFSIRGLMVLVALSALGIYGYQIYQDYALVAPLIRALRTGNTVAKINALDSLGRLGQRAWLAERSLIVASKDQRGMVRPFAIWALSRVAPRSKATIRVLIESLEDRGSGTRTRSADALQETGPASVETVRALGALVRKDDPRLRLKVITILDKIGTPTNGASAIVREALDDHDIAVVCVALGALGHLDPEPARALESIRKVASRPPGQWTGGGVPIYWSGPPIGREELIRRAIVRARFELAVRPEPPPGLVDDLLPMLDEPIEAVRQEAGSALLRLGPAARRRAVAVYAEQLRSAGADVDWAREMVLNLIRFDPENRGALPAMVERLGAEESAERMEAILELGMLGQAATPAAPALARLMLGPEASRPIAGFAASLPVPGERLGRSPVVEQARAEQADSPLRLGAIALRTIGERGQAEAVRLFIDALSDSDDAEHRAPAARALGALGPAARAAIPALKRACGDERSSVRDAAGAALPRIMPEKPVD